MVDLRQEETIDDDGWANLTWGTKIGLAVIAVSTCSVIGALIAWGVSR